MTKVIIFLLFPMFILAQANETAGTESGWLTNYETAIEKAKNEKKNVLIYFTGSDWCAPCKMLKKDLLENAEFKALSDNYVLLYIDIPMNKDLISSDQMQHNKRLSIKLNPKGSVPLFKIMSAAGKELDSYSGYSMNGEIQYHLDLLKKYL